MHRKESDSSRSTTTDAGSVSSPASHPIALSSDHPIAGPGRGNTSAAESTSRPLHLRTNTRSSLGFSSSTDDVQSQCRGTSASDATGTNVIGEDASGQASSTTQLPINGDDRPTTEPLDQSERAHLEAMTQTRFKHVATEEGHMILTGRDGELLRCEDEPIHIPGAVQSFGCMVVVREEEDGSLLVRQASEVRSMSFEASPAFRFVHELTTPACHAC